MRRFFTILVVVLFCTLIGFWSPWLYWDFQVSSLFGVAAPNEIAGLRAISVSGEMEVYVDNNLVGTANESNNFELIVDNIEPGNKLVQLSRKSDIENAYWDFSKIVNFQKGKTVVLSFNLGPSEVFSEGHLIYTTDKISESENNLKINVNVENSIVELDQIPLDVSKNSAESRIGFDKQHTLSIKKLGYDTSTFTILPEDQTQRDELKNSIINVEVYLIYQPVIIE